MVFNIPIIQLFEWDISEISSPVGHRHIAGSQGFVQILASGCQHSDPTRPATTSGTLHFKGTKFEVVDANPPSHIASTVHPITVHLGSSGVAISNMRLYLRDNSALRASRDYGMDPAIVQVTNSGIWHYLGTLPSGAAPRMSTTVPSFPNIFRQDGAAGLEGTDDANSSQFVYINVVIPFGTPTKTYGICGSGSLRFGLQFDYFPIG